MSAAEAIAEAPVPGSSAPASGGAAPVPVPGSATKPKRTKKKQV